MHALLTKHMIARPHRSLLRCLILGGGRINMLIRGVIPSFSPSYMHVYVSRSAAHVFDTPLPTPGKYPWGGEGACWLEYHPIWPGGGAGFLRSILIFFMSFEIAFQAYLTNLELGTRIVFVYCCVYLAL